jgi:hypothetical protein
LIGSRSDAESPSLIQHQEENAEAIIITARKSLKRHFLFLFETANKRKKMQSLALDGGQITLTLGPIPLFDATILKIGRIAFFQKMPARKHPSDFRERRLRRDVVRAASKGNTLTAD